MAQVINSNISSLNAQRNLNSSQASLATSLQRLSSGLRINSAKDDAAGLAISERFTTQIRGNDQAARNANDGISLAQSAEGDLVTIASNLQRMRELAVQAANATNSDSDRKAIDGEVQALSAEIDRVAQNSSFNGTKLLDGSFTAKNFQIGANNTSSDVIQISSISSARTSDLGSAGSTFSATNTGTATTAALAAGDLTLNGQQVGASKIGALPGQTTSSAYSIAEAINAVSAQSGVTATANPNTVSGSAATAFTAIAADTFSINGINIGAVAAGGTAAGQGANVAAAINQVSTQTGVTASANTTTGALTLTAADGRDINISTSAANKATLLTQTGLATGNVSVAGTTVSLGAFSTLTSTDATDKVGITVDGTTVLASTAVGAGGVTAATLATALNTFLTSNTGYQATLTSDGSSLGTAVTGANLTAGVSLTKSDGTAVDLQITFSDTTGALAPAGTTGGGFAGKTNGDVTATVSNTTAAGAGQVSNHGTITLSSTSADGIVLGGAGAANAGFTTGTTAATTTSSVNSIASVNVLTAANASKALDAIDGALQTINTSRASLGAYQNRFATVVDSLQTRTENLAASKSRITDADFAKETANLTRAQILQQAGTAMLSQANQLPQGVLSLLR
ncbi:MAG: flagellin [Methylomicrobium sp.]|jgi:flagellin